MKKLDVNALLEKNPGVDKEKIRRMAAGDLAQSPSHMKAYGSASPYSGKRMIADDQPREVIAVQNRSR